MNKSSKVKRFFIKFYSNKKLFFSIIAVLLCISVGITIALCCQHKHNYTEVTTITATCETAGEIQQVCDCGDVLGETIIVPPLGHQYVDGICVRCNKIQSKSKFEITKIEFVINDITVDKYSTEFYCDDFNVSIKINDGMNLDDYIAPTITWRFVGEDYGSTVSQDGTVSLKDFVGEITLGVTVESANILSATLPITVIQGATEIDSISVTVNEGCTQNYIEGDVFDLESISVWGEYETGIVRIYDFTVDKNPLTPDMTSIGVTYGDLITELPIVVNYKKLQAIEVVTEPSKTKYLDGQTFVKDGLVIRAHFENSTELVTDFDVDEIGKLSAGTDSVLISYTYNGITKTVKQNITVTPKKLLSISIDSSNVRTAYTQGDVFNTKGLIVRANFESFGEMEIFDYEYTKDILTTDNTCVQIFYTVGNVTKSEQIAVKVIKPYSQITQIKVLTPADIAVIWSYSYITDTGERIVDNTAYQANNLVYDKNNGLYEIPLGAVVTATIKNPSIVNVSLNGMEQTVNHNEKTVTWTMGEADLVVIKSIEMLGNHSVIRFAGQENEQSFLYEGDWNGTLTGENLQKIAAVFSDTEDYYHTYLFEGVTAKFADLANTIFVPNSVVTVIKNTISTNSKEVILHLDEDATYSIWLTPDSSIEQIPVFTLAGYNYDGWSLTSGGSKISSEDLKAFLSQSQTSYDLYIRWIKETVDYSDKFLNPDDDLPTFTTGTLNGSGGVTFVPGISAGGSGGTIGGTTVTKPVTEVIQFVGTWQFVVSQDGQTLSCSVVFNYDGSFEYTVKNNETVNCCYFGIFRLENEEILIISAETEMNIPLPNINDFNFKLLENAISANLIISTGESLVFVPCELTKAIASSGSTTIN